MHFLWVFAVQWAASLLTVIFPCSVLMIAEALLVDPGRPQPSWRARLCTLGNWAMWFLVATAYLMSVLPLWNTFHIHPLVTALAPPGLPPWLGLGAAVVVGLLAHDFFQYWCHRLEHRFFWRWHATHHSFREMSAITAYHHPAELIMKQLLYTLPLTLIMPDPTSIKIVATILVWQGHYLHSPTRLHFGPLGLIVMDNRFHRIHHSLRPEHYDKNFGVVTPLWDVVFGTAYFPKPGEWPDTGVEGFPDTHAPVTYLLGPLRYRSRVKEALTSSRSASV